MTKLSDVKSKGLLWDFMDYCIKNPELRFWQALRNWSEYTYIYGSKKGMDYGQFEDLEDTFYKEGK